MKTDVILNTDSKFINLPRNLLEELFEMNPNGPRPMIRRYEQKDRDEVLSLAERYTSWDSTPTQADIEGFYSSSPELFFVAEADGKVVGFVCGRESKHLPGETLMRWKANKAASIETLAVDETCRRRGIGTSLLNKLFETCRVSGIDLVTLSVPAEETEARNLYEKLGFEERAYFLRKRL